MSLNHSAAKAKIRGSLLKSALLLASGAAAALVACAGPTAAAEKIDGHPSFSGFWLLEGYRGPKKSPADLPGGWRTFGSPDRPGPPFRPSVYQEFRARRVSEEAAMKRDDGLDEKTAQCDAGGFPDVMSFGDPLDIHQRADEILMVTERDRQLPRHIYIVPNHPISEKYSPESNGLIFHNGHSVAHWEGDTLVVKTDALDPSPWMFSIERVPHSDVMAVTERFTLSADGKTLTDVMTITDPKTLTEPWVLKFNWHPAPADTESFEGSCDINFDYLGYKKK